ncbi:hypothetical protein Bca101_043910 [Brassica carinata]
MLPSRMAHHLTFHISMLLNWRKADRKVSEVMVFRDSTISKEVCRPQYMKVMCDEELVIVKVFAQKRKNYGQGEYSDQPDPCDGSEPRVIQK